MRRRILIVALAIGTIAGYAAGFRSMRHCRYERGLDRSGPSADAYRAGYEQGCSDALRHEK